MPRSFNPHNSSRGQIPPPFYRGNRLTLPSILERLLSRQRTSALARDLKTMARKQEPDRRAEGQAGKHRRCFHIPAGLQCGVGRAGMGPPQRTGRPVMEVMFRLLQKQMSGEHKTERLVGGEGPAVSLLLYLRRG